MIDLITAEIAGVGGKVETVQKMDKRPFSRVANKRFSTGFYVNFIFDMDPSNLAQLKHRFDLNDDVFRVLFTVAPGPKAAAPTA
jgi:ribosomal protein S6